MSASSRRDIILNVYNLTDEQGTGSFARAIGLGAYHSGVEVSGAEYTFAQNGVFFHTPKTPMVGPGQVVTLKESIPMGTHVGSANEVHGIINKLREEFAEGAYHPVTKNCNHFAEALCKELTGQTLPSWVNRPAKIGSFFYWGKGGKKKEEGGGASAAGGMPTTGGKKLGGAKLEKKASEKKEMSELQIARLEAIKRQASASASK